MFFSRIAINVGSTDPDELVALVKGNVYAIHQILWRLFPGVPNGNRDFLFRMEIGNGWPYFYVVSRRQPQSFGNAVDVKTKPYQPKLAGGQQLAFSLRANPVVTKKTADGNRRVRHDIVMDAKRTLPSPFSANSAISSSDIEYAAGIKWLQKRAESLGFHFDPDLVRIYGYQQHRFKSRKQEAPIQFSSLDFNGLLSVTDEDRFCQTLFKGIGRAKAFGCGLMLVRRV